MARIGRVPRELTRRPFTLREAYAAGLTLTALRSPTWRRLARGLYCWASLGEDPWRLLSGWNHYLPRGSVFAGSTAAWLHGLDVDGIHPVEVIVPAQSGVRTRSGLVIRHGHVKDAVNLRGLLATDIHRTLREVCRRLSPVEALVVLDAAVHAGLASPRAIAGNRRLRALAELAEPAESPMETRLRWLLLQAGLPKPEVQAELRDGDGRFVGRADLCYPSARLVVEYDGGNHRDRLVEDDRRQNALVNAGFRVLRFTVADLHQRPQVVGAQVRSALVTVSRDATASARSARSARPARFP